MEITNNVKISANAKELRELRHKEKMSIERLSLLSGIDASRLIGYELDRIELSVEEIDRIREIIPQFYPTN